MKKVVLEILQNSQESTCARVSFLMNVQVLGLKPAALLKKRLAQVLSREFAKFLKTPFLTEDLRCLLPLLVAKLDAYGFNRDTLAYIY